MVLERVDIYHFQQHNQRLCNVNLESVSYCHVKLWNLVKPKDYHDPSSIICTHVISNHTYIYCSKVIHSILLRTMMSEDCPK